MGLDGRGLEDLVGDKVCACLRFLGDEVVELGHETGRGVDVVGAMTVDESGERDRWLDKAAAKSGSRSLTHLMKLCFFRRDFCQSSRPSPRSTLIAMSMSPPRAALSMISQ